MQLNSNYIETFFNYNSSPDIRCLQTPVHAMTAHLLSCVTVFSSHFLKFLEDGSKMKFPSNSNDKGTLSVRNVTLRLNLCEIKPPNKLKINEIKFKKKFQFAPCYWQPYLLSVYCADSATMLCCIMQTYNCGS